MTSETLLHEEVDRDASFIKIMHGKSAKQRSAFLSMLKKDGLTHRMVTDEYLKHWETENTEEARDGRKTKYLSLVNNYYDLVTDLYEDGPNRFTSAASRLEGMKVLDVGCGVGRPAREIATFTGCNVVGLNNNSYQIERATGYAIKEGLADKVSFVKGDFMHIDFPENSFDAVYAIEATVHAPSLQGVYEQIYRVLKPGGTFGVFEWVMTDKYNEKDPEHRAISLGIERGDGIANMTCRKHALQAIQAAGFTLEYEEDLAARPNQIPWYYPLTGEFRHIRSLWDFLSVLRLTRVGRIAMSTLLKALETIRMAPAGTAETANELSLGADSLVAGGKAGLFTPMYLMIVKKPLA